MENYSAKLTGEPFLYRETKILGKYILDGYDIKSLKQKNIDENLIQYKSKNSIKRVNSAIFRRIGIMNEKMLNEFVYGDLYVSRMILLYTIMKTDRLVKDFVFEVYRNNILLLKDFIEDYEIKNWLDDKIASSSTLSNTSSLTQQKLKQVLTKIMVDSGLLVKNKDKYKIVIPIYSQKFEEMLLENNDIEYYRAIGGIV